MRDQAVAEQRVISEEVHRRRKRAERGTLANKEEKELHNHQSVSNSTRL